MQPPIQIPTLSIWPDRDTQQTWLYLEAQSPVDFTLTPTPSAIPHKS